MGLSNQYKVTWWKIFKKMEILTSRAFPPTFSSFPHTETTGKSSYFKLLIWKEKTTSVQKVKIVFCYRF